MADTFVVGFPGGMRVDVRAGELTVRTDQSPEHGGEGTAPEPFDLFLASLAACAGFYVLAFCRARSIATDGLEVRQHATKQDGRLAAVRLEVKLPAGFPSKYVNAVRAAVLGCKVKKTLESPPAFSVEIAAPE